MLQEEVGSPNLDVLKKDFKTVISSNAFTGKTFVPEEVKPLLCVPTEEEAGDLLDTASRTGDDTAFDGHSQSMEAMSSHGPVVITSPRPVKRATLEEPTQEDMGAKRAKVEDSVDEKILSQMSEEEIDTMMRDVSLQTQEAAGCHELELQFARQVVLCWSSFRKCASVDGMAKGMRFIAKKGKARMFATPAHHVKQAVKKKPA
eukprot:3835895-Amphidinium_carterae.2